VDWPGWCRSGRTADTAVEALVENAARFRRAIGTKQATGFDVGAPVKIVEKLVGDATTDFGAPSAVPRADARSLSTEEAARQVAILRASWRAFDRSARGAEGMVLTKGPRGGGRDLEAIVEHVFGADAAYLSRLGWSHRRTKSSIDEEAKALRREIIDALEARVAGEEPPPNPRRKAALWLPRYFIRRSAWHALDHAWEIEDRSP
jgi:hypothetical protein